MNVPGFFFFCSSPLITIKLGRQHENVGQKKEAKATSDLIDEYTSLLTDSFDSRGHQLGGLLANHFVHLGQAEIGPITFDDA